MPEEVWGKEEGYCAWCVDAPALDVVWEYAIDSQGEHVKYACCKQCAADRGVEEEEMGQVKETDGYMTAEELKNMKPVRGISGAGVRTLNIPALGFEVVVLGGDAKTTETIEDMINKGLAEEVK